MQVNRTNHKMLTEDTCIECGIGTLQRKITDLTGERNGEEFTVRAEGLVCPACGFKTIDNDQGGEFTRLVSDAYRAKHGLLTGIQIRQARKLLGMTQQNFAAYLKVGVASVKRWELGLIQDAAMDELMRVKTDVYTADRNRKEVIHRIAIAHHTQHSQTITWTVGVTQPLQQAHEWEIAKQPEASSRVAAQECAYCYEA
jgi:putative zinc finger/helix-turn-helix YgiT family protein